jgi:hypothetical protein
VLTNYCENDTFWSLGCQTAANQQVDLLAYKQGEQGAQLKDHPRVIYQQLIGCVQSADATILLVEQCVSRWVIQIFCSTQHTNKHA